MSFSLHQKMWLVFTLMILVSSTARANMAMPFHGENLWGEPFTNASVDIIHEDMLIELDDSFNYANYTINYTIEVNEDSLNVPLLFYAFDFLDSFQVWVNDTEVGLMDVPTNYFDMDGTSFENFKYLFQTSDVYDDNRIILEESQQRDWHILLEDLKFFDTNLGAGKHTIKVVYRAAAWMDEGGVINAYSFRYVLSPATLWKSFGQLDITIDASANVYPLTTNLGQPNSGSLDEIATWTFDSIPVPVLEIYYKPELNTVARALLWISPFGLALIPSLFLVCFFLLKAYRYRLGNRISLANPWVYLGALILPGIFLLLWIMGYPFIRLVIGEEASRVYGYMSIMFMVLYPPIAIVFMLVTGAADLVLRRYLRKREVG